MEDAGTDRFLIDITKLISGDIILTRSNSRESILIRRLTQSNYSHALLYVGFSSAIESDGLGVHSQNLQRLLFEHPEEVTVLRVEMKEQTEALNKIVLYSRSKIGTEYSTAEAKLAYLEKEIEAKEPNRQYCSRFIAQSFEYGGLNLVKNSAYCSPQDLIESELLEELSDVLVKANKLEIEFANSQNNPIAIQRDVTNKIFETTRNITGLDIQSYEQLSKCVLDNPEMEPAITELVESSGYLDLWEMDVIRNPWYYDYDKFCRHFTTREQRIEVAEYFASNEPQNRKRFEVTLQSLRHGYSFYKQKYFKAQIDLYKHLIKLSNTREGVARRILKKYGRIGLR